MEARNFLDNFQCTDIDKDPLPIKVLRNAITKEEIVGQAVYWGFEYLDQRSCPQSLLYKLIQKLYEEIPQADFSHCAEDFHSGGTGDVSGESGGEFGARFEPLKLMQAIVKKVDELCLKEREDVHDSVDGIIESPDMLPNVYAVSYNNIKNTRRFMEDRMSVLPRMDRVFNLPVPISYFAVFDGHNGSEAAAYGAAQLHQYLLDSMKKQDSMIQNISDAFETLDEVFVEKCLIGKVKSGSTAVMCLLMTDKLYCAWVGDSQAVLSKRTDVINLVVPHKPERLDEMDRIRSLGGEVYNLSGTCRVNGNLAVSRAIGDADFKTYIIATPDIKMMELDGTEEFLILGCDGLWDEVSPEMAAYIVRRQIVDEPSNIPAVSQKLIQKAKQNGSTDNITVIVVFLESVESIKNRYENNLPELVETGLTTSKQSFDRDGLSPSNRLIEGNVDDHISHITAMNGHGKDGEPLVDFLSLGSSKESGGQVISDGVDGWEKGHGEDDIEVKEVEELSDGESDDEWQYEKPVNPEILQNNGSDQGVDISEDFEVERQQSSGMGYAQVVGGSDALLNEAEAAKDDGGRLSVESPIKNQVAEEIGTLMNTQPFDHATESFNPFATENPSDEFNVRNTAGNEATECGDYDHEASKLKDLPRAINLLEGMEDYGNAGHLPQTLDVNAAETQDSSVTWDKAHNVTNQNDVDVDFEFMQKPPHQDIEMSESSVDHFISADQQQTITESVNPFSSEGIIQVNDQKKAFSDEQTAPADSDEPMVEESINPFGVQYDFQPGLNETHLTDELISSPDAVVQDLLAGVDNLVQIETNPIPEDFLDEYSNEHIISEQSFELQTDSAVLNNPFTPETTMNDVVSQADLQNVVESENLSNLSELNPFQSVYDNSFVNPSPTPETAHPVEFRMGVVEDNNLFENETNVEPTELTERETRVDDSPDDQARLDETTKSFTPEAPIIETTDLTVENQGSAGKSLDLIENQPHLDEVHTSYENQPLVNEVVNNIFEEKDLGNEITNLVTNQPGADEASYLFGRQEPFGEIIQGMKSVEESLVDDTMEKDSLIPTEFNDLKSNALEDFTILKLSGERPIENPESVEVLLAPKEIQDPVSPDISHELFANIGLQATLEQDVKVEQYTTETSTEMVPDVVDIKELLTSEKDEQIDDLMQPVEEVENLKNDFQAVSLGTESVKSPSPDPIGKTDSGMQKSEVINDDGKASIEDVIVPLDSNRNVVDAQGPPETDPTAVVNGNVCPVQEPPFVANQQVVNFESAPFDGVIRNELDDSGVASSPVDNVVEPVVLEDVIKVVKQTIQAPKQKTATTENKSAPKTAKSPAKPEVAKTTRTSLSSAAVRKSPSKPAASDSAPKVGLINGKVATASTVNKSLASKTAPSAPKTVPAKVGAPASALAKPMANRATPPARTVATKAKEGVETAKPPSQAKPLASAAPRPRPITAPTSSAKPLPAKQGTTSPKRAPAPPGAAASRPATGTRPPVAFKTTEADSKTAAAKRPTPAGTISAKVTAKPENKPSGTDAKKASTSAPGLASRTGVTKPAAPKSSTNRPAPTLTKTVPQKATTAATGIKPTTTRTAPKPDEKSTVAGTRTTTARPPTSTKAPSASKKIDTTLKAKKPLPPASKTGVAPSKVIKTKSSSGKTEVIDQNGTSANKEEVTNNGINITNGVNGDHHGETDKEDVVQSNGVHVPSAIPGAEVEDLLG